MMQPPSSCHRRRRRHDSTTTRPNALLLASASAWAILFLLTIASSKECQAARSPTTTTTSLNAQRPFRHHYHPNNKSNDNNKPASATKILEDKLSDHDGLASSRSAAAASTIINSRNSNTLWVRGGASSPETTNSGSKKNKAKSASSLAAAAAAASTSGTVKRKKKKSNKKKQSNTEGNKGSQGKTAINEAMEQDAAQVLGDAIRSRADELRSENPLLERIDQSVYSVGWALGASDFPRPRRLDLGGAPSSHSGNKDNNEGMAAVADEDDGGVEGSPTSVLVSYFLKSHGGAHAVQCVCSLLASAAGVCSLVVPAKSPMRLVLLKRTFLFAMIKHVAGLVGAALVAGRAIPEVGLRKARVWMEQLARDPVSQYVFYAACILLWLPPTPSTATVLGATTGATAVTQSLVLSAEKFPWIPLVLVGPILLREVVSTMLVISDVLVLWATSSSSSDDMQSAEAIQNLLQIGQKAVNVVMSLLVTPTRWRNADPATRQQILAKLTSKLSLVLELVVGVIISVDAVGRVGQFLFGTASGVKPPFRSVVKRLLCARIYLQFLYVRKQKINRLATSIRGGAAQLPFYVLDVLTDPRAALGLQPPPKKQQQVKRDMNEMTWKDYAMIALGLDG